MIYNEEISSVEFKSKKWVLRTQSVLYRPDPSCCLKVIIISELIKGSVVEPLTLRVAVLRINQWLANQ